MPCFDPRPVVRTQAVHGAQVAAEKTAHAAREFWATIGPGGRWHPQTFFDLQVTERLCDCHCNRV